MDIGRILRFQFSLGRLLGCATVIAVLTGIAVQVTKVNREWSKAGRRANRRDNLRKIVSAMHNYDAVYGCLPPAYVVDNEGIPIHSWRVLLLPFLGEGTLYEAYHFDEPWDGPHNRALSAKVPAAYRRDRPRTHIDHSADYVVITGTHTAFPAPECRSMMAISRSDGTSDTILVLEAEGLSLDWMQPRDLRYDDLSPENGNEWARRLSALENVKAEGGFSIGLCDGSTRWLDRATDSRTLRSMMTAVGGEDIPFADN